MSTIYPSADLVEIDTTEQSAVSLLAIGSFGVALMYAAVCRRVGGAPSIHRIGTVFLTFCRR